MSKLVCSKSTSGAGGHTAGGRGFDPPLCDTKYFMNGSYVYPPWRSGLQVSSSVLPDFEYVRLETC